LTIDAKKSGGIDGEITLDPANWETLSTLAHRMLDDMLNHHQTIRARPYSSLTDEAINAIRVPLSREGDGEEATFEIFVNHILPYVFGNQSPRSWGLVVGTGSPYGMLTDMLRGGVNSPTETFGAEGYVHQQVIDWIKKLLEYPAAASGVIVGGGSEANFTCLAVARNAMAEVDMKTQGMQGLQRRMTLYCGDETHHCLERSVELLGLGSDALRWIPTDDDCTIRLDALQKAISNDRKQNFHPFCVIGCAGTVNSGAFDNLPALATFCAKENLWFHIDGAFGAWVKLSETHRQLARGLESADSVAIDLHKWMYMPYGIGCALVRDPFAHYSTFVYGHEARYLKSTFEDIHDKFRDTHNLALPLSRSFNSLKAYMLLRAYGTQKYRQLIQQNLNQIRYLAELIKNEDMLEITAPVTSNIVCFRYKPSNLSEDDVETLNRALYDALSHIKLMMISDTTIKGQYMLRACNVNHRSQRTDFEFLVKEITRVGSRLLSQFPSNPANTR
jgi:glutamate/tyrosine decarboxylase-like PLP-dependent enzyme